MPHFVTHLQTAALIWASLRLMLSQPSVNPNSIMWTLRPRHLAVDFAPVARLVREAFEKKTADHWRRCELCRLVPLLVVDGKWSLICPLCTDRGSGDVWREDLGVGCLTGCKNRFAQARSVLLF